MDIRWTTLGEGGRVQPPALMAGQTYCPVSRFESLPDDWSVSIQISPGAGCYLLEFLVEAAPHQALVKGAKFELMEGRKVVARGIVR